MFLDGAMGTMVQRLKLEESHFRGKVFFAWSIRATQHAYTETCRRGILDLGQRFEG